MPTPIIPPPDLEGIGAYWVSDELRNAYWLALGEFVDTYGGTEGILLHYVTWFIANKLGDGTGDAFKFARSLIGSQRAGEIAKIRKRAMRLAASSDEDVALTEFALSHFADIHALRDRIVHQGASPEFYQGRWMVRNSNHNQIREDDQHEEIWFSIEDLTDMSEDLWTIQTLIRSAMLHAWAPMKEFEPHELLKHTWRYKPSSLIRVRHTKQNTKKEQKRPRPSSRA